MSRDRAIRILHCIPSLGGGGSEKQLSYLAPNMAMLGSNEHLAFVHDGLNSEFLKPAVSLHQLTGRGNYDPALVYKLIKLIRTIRPDVIQTWILQMDVIGGIAAMATRTPWVLREPSSSAVPNSLKRALRLHLARGASAVIANSTDGLRYWRTHYPEKKMALIPNAVPVEAIRDASARSLSEFGIRDDQKVVLYVGRLIPSKNLKCLIGALARVMKDQSVMAVLCGDGPLLIELKQDIRLAGLENRILLPGYEPSVWGMMKRADVFVFPSHFEGCPNAVLEAMACGTPLVVSDIAAHRELLDDNSALFVDRSDPERMARAIMDSIENISASRQRAEHAKMVVANLSPSDVAQKYLDTYTNVLNNLRTPVK